MVTTNFSKNKNLTEVNQVCIISPVERSDMEFERIAEPTYLEGVRKHGRQKNRGVAQRNSRIRWFLAALDAEPNQWMILKRKPRTEENHRKVMVSIQAERISLENRHPDYDWEQGVDEGGWYIAARRRPRPRTREAAAWIEEHSAVIHQALLGHMQSHSALLSTSITDNDEEGVKTHVEAISKIKNAIDWITKGNN